VLGEKGDINDVIIVLWPEDGHHGGHVQEQQRGWGQDGLKDITFIKLVVALNLLIFFGDFSINFCTNFICLPDPIKWKTVSALPALPSPQLA
jgi:hypothetical protein